MANNRRDTSLMSVKQDSFLRVLCRRKSFNTEAAERLRVLCVEAFKTQRTQCVSATNADSPLRSE